MQGGIKNPIFRFIYKTIQDTAIVTMECEYETVPKLSNGTISSNVEWSSNLDFNVIIQGYYSLFNAE